MPVSQTQVPLCFNPLVFWTLPDLSDEGISFVSVRDLLLNFLLQSKKDKAVSPREPIALCGHGSHSPTELGLLFLQGLLGCPMKQYPAILSLEQRIEEDTSYHGIRVLSAGF